ncbi:E3 ubiquitin-protein ligase ATL6-like [Gastrolobium bilobum]|uniref:E3 ubiquitin-protein ligase ATL6-like n=1 Tax=Gastrolobium bilobum TaxID=150636 RepID=UPI002AAFCDE4|nr:E3 ubiquitin-protein ligase ATL6-like [Gastrolobium bilobum]
MEWAHLLFFIVLVVPVFHSCVYAQTGTSSNPPFAITLKENLKDTLSVMSVAFFSAFVFMGFFSLYLRHCSSGYGANIRNPITAAAGLCRGGFNRQVIDKCPILVYSTVKDLQIGKGSLECAVCLSEFQDFDNIRLLPKCYHVFHPDCIDAWLLSHMNCPVCRARVTCGDVGDIAIPIPMLTASNNIENNNTTTTPEITGREMEQQQEVVRNNMEKGQSSTVTESEESEPERAPRESRMLEKFKRSHSTGHSLVEAEENVKVVDSDVVLPGAWSSKTTACYTSNNDVERWSLSMTPPFLFNNNNLGNERICWTPPLRMSFYKAHGAQKPSHLRSV